ncbi:hypothetical protein BC349_04675 [Flavihumibacter stibioxidans]|uniref:Phosphate:Na+ symporter n=2 Tax=Flavihumibacter stibioxidans TaxID=1834163 RepID=A0ABR7M5F5_9BACT|nr:Na/Pi symporter [Flavihumibacter stibioxidans]MBC6490246.1 hypothetical protein [Flavihumibacter stibioxidans]
MTAMADIWKMIAGIAIFILGMRFLEDSLKTIAGRPFKLLLRKQTTNKFKGILGGAVVTGILQSSSVVNIMVLAFVGAGVIKMQNALALMLGSNLGTTLTSWIIATVGFKFNIENLALPITGLAGILWAMNSAGSKWHRWLQFFLGFGFMLLGLDFMKTGMEETVKQVDLSQFNQYPSIVFVLAGMVITSLVQSSSATVALVLSALYSGGISLYEGAAIVLGAEIGTTIKLLIAAQGNIPDKKRVALGNFLFNTITTLVVFISLHPILDLITGSFGLKDNLVALVFFQSTVNIIGILLFFPLLNVFGKWLQNRFHQTETEASFIHAVPVTDSELAIQAIEKEIRHFMYHVIDFALDSLAIKNISVPTIHQAKGHSERSIPEKYEFIKELHGDIQGYYIKLQSNTSEKDKTVRLESLVSALRNAMYAAKSMKDAWGDAVQLSNSSNELKYGYYKLSQDRISTFIHQLLSILDGPGGEQSEKMIQLYYQVAEQYNQSVQTLYKENIYVHLSDSEITTIVNYNRELYTAKKSILLAVKDFILDTESAARFNELPGFIR